jgi:hypothetical protein
MKKVHILTNCASVASLFFFYFAVSVFKIPKFFFGFGLLVIIIVNSPFISDVTLWCVHSGIYWACELPYEDNFILLAITTLVFAAFIISSEMLPIYLRNEHNDIINTAERIICILPIACNNILLHPFSGIVRYVVFEGVGIYFGKEYRYLLFSTEIASDSK